MTPATMFYNASICGAVASAQLHAAPCAPKPIDAAAAPAPAFAAKPAPQGWRRGIGAIVDLVSGPAPVRA